MKFTVNMIFLLYIFKIWFSCTKKTKRFPYHNTYQKIFYSYTHSFLEVTEDIFIPGKESSPSPVSKTDDIGASYTPKGKQEISVCENAKISILRYCTKAMELKIQKFCVWRKTTVRRFKWLNYQEIDVQCVIEPHKG